MATPNKSDKKEPDTRREIRVIKSSDIEMRIEGDGDETRLVGYAAKFNRWSEDLGFFREKIDPGAFTEALKTSDVRALKNHDPNLVLGRSTAGTLRLDQNKIGLKFDIDIPNTTTGQDVREEVTRGDITGCSFAFTVVGEKWEYPDDGPAERTILQFGELFDVGPVTYPAYPDTTVAARSMTDGMDATKRQKHIEGEEDPELQEKEWTFEERHAFDAGYRYAGRVLNRNRPADD